MKNLRGQNTLEYIFIIGIVAAGLAAMLVYFGRAFQGNIRDKAEQLGAGQYDPGKMTVDNKTTKTVSSTVISKDITKIQYADLSFAKTLQDQITAQLALMKLNEIDLMALRNDYEKAIQAEAAKQANYGVIDKIKDRLAPSFSGEANKEKIEGLLAQAQNLKAQIDNAAANENKLTVQLNIANEDLAKDPDNAQLKDSVASIQKQIDQLKESGPMVQLAYDRAVLEYMDKKLASSATDATCQARFNQLVKSYTAPPCESVDPLECSTPYYSDPYYGKETKACSPPGSCGPPYESPEQAKNDIQAQLDAKLEEGKKEGEAEDNPLIAIDYTDGQKEALQNKTATVFDAIDAIRPPFSVKNIGDMELTAIEYQTKLLNKETEYFTNVTNYLSLSQQLKQLYATNLKPNETLYVGHENQADVHTSVIKTKKENLNKF
ncbi:MAG: hypothetical protein WC543_00940 [Candidatus Omnitrophota bacterium]